MHDKEKKNDEQCNSLSRENWRLVTDESIEEYTSNE
jgi:hypothetical protein